MNRQCTEEKMANKLNRKKKLVLMKCKPKQRAITFTIVANLIT